MLFHYLCVSRDNSDASYGQEFFRLKSQAALENWSEKCFSFSKMAEGVAFFTIAFTI
jgi:hypothetical protein